MLFVHRQCLKCYYDFILLFGKCVNVLFSVTLRDVQIMTTPRSRILLENRQPVTWLKRKSLTFYGSARFAAVFRQSVTEHYPEPDVST
jgi:hypothetical protein